MTAVLFVCTANQIRSPFAQELFKQMLAARGVAELWRVESAGTWAAEGLPAAPLALLAGSEFGLDLGQHRSRVINVEIMNSFDLVLVMEMGHKEALQIEFQRSASRVYLLSEMVGERFDVRDPIGGGMEDYRAIYRQIRQLLEEGFEQIIGLATQLGEAEL